MRSNEKKARSRCPPYTSKIIKTGALLADPKTLLSHWDLEELVITVKNQPIATLSRNPRTSWPCQPGSAKNKNHWMAENFDEPLGDFNEHIK